VRLHLYTAWLQSDERVRDRACKHALDGTADQLTEVLRLCAEGVQTR
jgi:hypothetical protein